jgi:tetratricopeptide (TPR) repeat protein
MRGISRRSYRPRVALAVFLGLVAALGIDVKLAHLQTKEAEALTAQFNKLYGQGRYSEAIPLVQRILAIREKSLGDGHPNVATWLNNLAEMYKEQGRYTDAELLFKRSLTIDEGALGRDHPDIAASLNNLASLYDAQGRYADALPIVQRTIAQNYATKSVALGVLHDSQSQNLIGPT